MFTLFEIAINLFEGWLILYFMKSKLYISKPCLCADILCVTACTTFYSLYLFIEMPSNDIIIYVFPFLYSLFVSKTKWYLSLFWTLMLAVLFTSTASLYTHAFAMIFSTSMSSLMAPGLLRTLLLISSNTVLYFIIRSASKLSKDHLYLSWPALLTFLAVSIGILIAEECFYRLQQTVGGEASVYILGNTCLLVCSMLTIHLFHFLSESSARESQYKFEIGLYISTLNHQEEFKRIYEGLIQLRHDFRHHLDALNILITQNATQEAQAYLSSYRAEFDKSDLFTTGCTMADALLTAKRMTMKAHGIRFDFTSCPLNVLPLEPPKFCAVVGNLLDNAIEGTLRVKHPDASPVISLTLSRVHNVFRIVCENPCNPQSVKQEKGIWRSSKRRSSYSDFHGIGISSIRRIIGEANGNCFFTTHGPLFHADLTIPFPHVSENEEASIHESNRGSRHLPS